MKYSPYLCQSISRRKIFFKLQRHMSRGMSNKCISLPHLIILLGLVAFSVPSWSITPVPSTPDSTRFTFFFLNNRTDMDMEVAANADELNRLGAFLLAQGSRAPLVNVRLSSSASPAGVIQHNMELCYSRAQTLQQFLYTTFPGCFNSSTHWDIYFYGENWDGFEKATEQSDIRDRDEVLGIIRRAPSLLDANGFESRKTAIRQLHGGTTW